MGPRPAKMRGGGGQVWSPIPVILALGKLREKGRFKYQTGLGSCVRHYPETSKTRAWWYRPEIPAPRRNQRQEDQEFKSSLSPGEPVVRSSRGCLKLPVFSPLRLACSDHRHAQHIWISMPHVQSSLAVWLSPSYQLTFLSCLHGEDL